MSLARITAGLVFTPIQRTVEVSTEVTGVDDTPAIRARDDVANQVADRRHSVELMLVIAIQTTMRIFIAPDTVSRDNLFMAVGILDSNR